MKINFALILFSNIDRKWNILETYHPSDIMFQGIFETLVNYKVFGSSTGISMEKFQVSEWERVSKFSMSQSLYRGGKLGIFFSPTAYIEGAYVEGKARSFSKWGNARTSHFPSARVYIEGACLYGGGDLGILSSPKPM